MRLAAIILLGASMSCLAPASSPGQSTRKDSHLDSQRAALREKILAEKGSDYLSKGVGACQLGVASADLDVNNVRARLYNTGGLFWRGFGPMYNVPKQTRGNAIFAHGIWIGGMVDGELHAAASSYGPWEFWPGALDENGNPPDDCSQYDRMFKVSREDVLEYEATARATPDLADWPHELGAPVIDGDHDPNNYNLQGGDRPEILGDQTIWWVMNDRSNEHSWSLAPPIGLEVQVTAFALKQPGLDNTTFYRYRLINKSGSRLEEAWFGAWTDADLGDAGDDYVGSDTLRGLGYTWNGDDFDGGSDGYGDLPPAVGVALLQGPLVNDDEIDNDRDGQTDEEGERLGMTTFMALFKNTGVTGEPNNAREVYWRMQGRWRNGEHVTHGGYGYSFSDVETNFHFPDHPPAFWSEEDIYNQGIRNTPSDRRMLVATGPFALEADEAEEIVYAIVWSRGKDRFDSVSKLKSDVALIQAVHNCLCYTPIFPDSPTLSASQFDGEVVLKWQTEPSSNIYLDHFELSNAFLEDIDVEDKTHSFEGYDVLQYESEGDNRGTVIATFDVPNGVTKVVDIVDATTNIPVSEVTAFGTDSGVRHSLRIGGLDNYKDYYFGVRAYAFNAHSAPQILRGQVSRITVRPSRIDARNGGTHIADGAFEAEFTAQNGRVTHEGQGNGAVSARVVDPSILTGDTYRIRFYEQYISDDRAEPRLVTNYDVLRSDGSKAFDGTTAVSSFAEAAPQAEDVLTIDGLSFSITGPEPAAMEVDLESGMPAFVQVASPSLIWCRGNGSVFGCRQVGGDLVYASFNDTGDWIMYHHGGAGPEESIGAFAPHDFEIRVTEEGSYGYHPFSDGNGEIHWVPFEVWDIGINPPFTVNDAADDVQLVPAILSDGGGTCAFNFGEIAEDPFDLGWPVTDRIYAYYPVGERYADWDAAARALVESNPDGCPASPATDAASDLIDFARGRPLQRLTFMMDPASPNYRESMIPVGNVIRFFTTKPNLPGDIFTVNTSGYAAETNVSEVARDALEQIAIVPNPYKGASDYEVNNLADVARFTNLPEKATIRVFDLGGTLVRSLNKAGPATSLEWDLLTDNDLPMASGMYLVHVDVPGVGSKVIKFGVVKKRIQLDLY